MKEVNWVNINRKILEKQNYILKADSSTDYWFALAENKVQDYRVQTRDNFNIIVFGNEEIETDFYIIPFKFLSDILIKKNLYTKNNRNRWVADIKNQKIKFRVCNIERNISEFYSIPLLNDKKSSNNLLDEDANDYSIENAKREISVRLNQSKFRTSVLTNFENKCCLSGIAESNLLIASHIIPWANRIETRLDPGNGLCLMVLYDKLFDKGYFTLDDNLKVIITKKNPNLSLETQKWLQSIEGKQIYSPSKFLISKTALKYHRERIFVQF